MERLRAAPGLRLLAEPDNGQSDALNKGTLMARGEILTWLMADDELVPRATEWAVRELVRRPQLGWVFGQVRTCWPDGREAVFRPPRRMCPSVFRFHHGVATQRTYLRSWAAEQVGDFDTGLELEMDYDLWLRLALRRVPCAYIRRELGRFEIHAESKNGNATALDNLSERQRVLVKRGRVEDARALLAFDAPHRPPRGNSPKPRGAALPGGGGGGAARAGSPRQARPSKRAGLAGALPPCAAVGAPAQTPARTAGQLVSRSRSASTISRISSSKLVVGSHPSSRLAFVQSPIR